MPTIRKVWTCYYTGRHSAAPKVIQVPSENATGRPSGREIVAALKAMGLSDGIAESIGSGSLDWRCE